MVLRKLTMALLGMGVMLPGFTHALAVRDIQTKSSLGQPLRVEVELSDLGDLSSEDIKIGLATQEDFDRLGIERSFFLAELRFEVVVNAGSRSYIKITSAKRVSEPFLDFVIRITWPGNTRLQELPILLDPPMSASARPAVIEAPVIVAAPVVAAPEVARVEPPTPVQAVEDEANPESVYRVRRHDNLWAIAQRVRPGNNVSVHRMMQALFKANPGAFVANNINMLRNGEVLRVPTLNEAQSAADRATAAVPPAKAQTLSAAAKDKPSRQQINATASANRKVQATTSSRVEMRLVAPAGGSTPAAGRHDKSPKHASEHSGSGGQAGVAVSGKGHPGKRKSPSVLASEVAALENQLKSNDKTIAMQNATLARLEAQLKARAAQEQQSRQKPGEKSDKGLTGKALATLACGVATQSFLSTEAKAADAPAAATGGSSMMPIIAGVVVLLLVIGAIIAMKGKSKPAQRPSAPPAPAPKPVAPKPQEPVAAKPAAPEPKKPLDAAEEAQGYISMERYPQAVGVLNKALAHTPDRADLHLMLLEIYVKQQDRQSFEEQYVRLESLGELEAIMRADELKSLLPKPVAPAPSKEDGIEFVREDIKTEEVHHDAGPSLEDLEKDFALSLSQPNLKALDLEIRETPSVAAAAEQAKVDEIDSLLEQELEFSFTPKPAEPAAAPVDETPFELDFSFTEPEPSKPAPVVVEELSLDSLDAFLEEQKAIPEAKPEVIEPVVEEAAFDFEKALADYKGEAGEPAAEPEVNLAEGFELEEFNVSQINLPVADVALRSETQTDLDAFEGDFSLDEFAQTPAPAVEPEPNLAALDGGMDLGSAAAAFDAELAGHGADQPAAEEAAVEEMGLAAGDDALSSLDREFGFLATTNENTTRLELARAYAEMGDKAAARDLLEEVVADGDENQKNEAQGMLMRIA